VTAEDLLERISVDPAVCGGKPCIRGHRIWVGLVLGMLAEGAAVEDVLADYPQLVDSDIRACMAYGARLANARYLELQ
jgi:uncharacterized protein (DUF433 family)